MNVYTLFAMDDEPETRVIGEMGHEIVGVYESLDDAKKVAEQYKCNRDALLIVRSVVGGASFRSEEVWKWDIRED